MVMELNQAIHRESLNDAENAQPPCMPASPDGVAERKARRYTRAFNSYGSQNTPAAEESHTNSSSSEAEPFSKLWKRNSSPSLQSQSSLPARTSDAEQQNRSGLRRARSQQTGGLATIMEKKYVEISTVAQTRGAAPKVKRWDARTRTTSVWDSLRRDSELFSQRGNCSIHLYEKGQSRRGPSFRIPLERLYSARFASLFTLFHIEFARHDDFEEDIMHRQCDLYMPAPESSRKEAFTWHITTRNFFAFILGRPVVGTILGQALIDLRERLDVFRPNDTRNHDEFMAYLEKAGYLEFAHAPDYALALLNVAEHFKLQELWVDAFAHCVGMESVLRSHPEFHSVSRVTHALITRAYLEMDLHLGRVTRSLSNFLEDDFSPSHFGASAGTRLHLDRFRTFLNEYYVAKFGYWPPPKRANFSKSLYKSMYFDFRSLYDYLVDLDSTSSLGHQKPASGGICVLQNVKAFDERHKMIPLPHPHPLLPHEPAMLQRTTSSQTSLLRYAHMLGPKMDPATELNMLRDSLSAASNMQDASITCAPIVKAYQRFEMASVRRSEERISLCDARKVRWLLIYATLQMLISVTRAPKEVRMTETTYPLCCLVTGTPPWQAGLKALKGAHTASVLAQASAPAPKHVDIMSFTTLHPDCELDDYLSRRTSSLVSSDASRRASTLSTRTESSPNLPSKVGLLRNASIRSVKTLSSSIGSLSRRASLRRNSLPPTPSPVRQLPLPAESIATSGKSSNFCEIVVHGYGNGLTESLYTEPARFVPIELRSESLPEIVIINNSPPRSQDEPATDEPEVRPRSSRRSERPDRLVLRAETSKVEDKSRTPLMDSFDNALPGLAEREDSSNSSSSSTKSESSPPPTLSWSSSRSTSPHSSTSCSDEVQTTVQEIERKSSQDLPSPVSPSCSESTFSTLSPVSPVTTFLPILPSKKSMDLPMVVAIEEMNVYQPTGVPSVGTVQIVEDEEEEFPDREASKRWSVASKTHTIPLPLKSSLRRAHTAATAVANKRSVRIKV